MEATRVVLEIEVGSDPLRGWCVGGDGLRRSFEGWLELAALVVDLANGRGRPASLAVSDSTPVVRRRRGRAPVPGAPAERTQVDEGAGELQPGR